MSDKYNDPDWIAEKMFGEEHNMPEIKFTWQQTEETTDDLAYFTTWKAINALLAEFEKQYLAGDLGKMAWQRVNHYIKTLHAVNLAVRFTRLYGKDKENGQ